MAVLLNCQALSKWYTTRPLFTEISFVLSEGQRTALIGPNGAGKSTLLRIIAGLEHADAGQIETKRQLRLGYLPQDDVFPAGATAEQVVLEAVASRHLEEHQRLAEARIMLGKLGFTRMDQPAEEFSGGWRKRLALARELVKDPELLLLDEPTNHLDVQSILFLEKLLRNASFGLLLVSHDRYFLENVTNRTIELSRAYEGGYLSIDGPYSDFLVKREEYLVSQQSQQQSLAGRVRGEIEWLKRGAKARTTKAKGRIQEAQRMMGELDELKVRNAQGAKVQIDFTASGRKTRKLLEAADIAKSLGGRALFERLSITISPGMKLGLLGPNGSGKTTLIRILAGQIEPDAGQIRRADGLRIVLFDQNRQQLDSNLTLRKALCPIGENIRYRESTMHVSAWARRFLFRTEQLDMLLSDLSGGERARVHIANLMLQEADLLILDEPTNDLDIPSLEVMEESLEDFPGAVVLVTHDRYLLDRLCTDVLALDGQGHASIYADYPQWEQAQEREAKERARERDAAGKTAAARPAAPPPPGKKRLTYMEQREWEQMEEKILAAEEELAAAHSAMDDPATLADHRKLHDACVRHQQAQELVAKLYARWEELEAKQG